MLYLVRKLGEAIVVNNDIEITLVEIKRNSVKLGITFPPTATVLRKEIHDRISAENKSAQENIKTITLDLPIVRESESDN